MPGLIKNIFLFLLFSGMGCLAYGQIGIGVNPPNASAILHVQDTARGLLISRMTAAQRINIQNPAEGLMVYQTDSPAGFWYFRSGQWVNTFPSNGGRSTLVLADTITDAEAQLKIANEVGPNTQEIRILRCSNLTTVDLSMLTNSLLEIYIDGNPVLQNVNLGNLTAIDGGMYVNNCPQLTTLNIHSVGRIGQTFANTVSNGSYWGINITGTGILDINLPVVKQVAGLIDVQSNPALTNLSMPQLQSIQTVRIIDCPLLANISFHALKNLGVLNMTTPTELATADFSSLMTAVSLYLKGNQLSSISFPVLTNVTSQMDISAPQLASAVFPVLQVCPFFTVNAGSQLSTVSAPLLVTSKIKLTGGSMNAVNFNSLQTSTGITISASSGSLTFPALQTSSYNNAALINVSGIGTLSFPLLHKADGFAASQISSISVPLLDTIKNSLEISNSPSLSALSFPALKKSSVVSITNCGMSSVSFPAFITNYEYNASLTGINIYTNPNLTSISWPNFQVMYGECNLKNNKFPSSEVNALLAKFRVMSLYYGYVPVIYLKQIPAAPPTGQGIADKNYLISTNIYVETD